MKERLRVAVLGAGRIGKMHAEHIVHHVPRARLVSVVDLQEDLAQACALACGIDDYGTSVSSILDRSDVDAVAICTSSTTHTEIIEAAAGAGKHIFCEKPIDLTLERIDSALEAVESAGVLFQVGFQKRFDPSYQRIRRAIDDGEIGTPYSVHIASRDPAPPPIEFLRTSGGLFLDMTIHDFDMSCFLMGHDVITVYAAAAVRVDPAIGAIGDVDTATIVLQYGDGTLLTIENGRSSAFGYDQRVEVFGSKGSIRVDNAYPTTATLSTEESVRRDVPYHFFLDRYKGAYIEELRAFSEAVLDGKPSPLSGKEARMPVVIGLAAKLSLKAGRPVEIAEIASPT